MTNNIFPTKPCSSCGAFMVWATTPNGKRACFDAVPVEAGTYTLTQGPHGPLSAYVRSEDRAAFAGRLYVSHWATCPTAAQHRKVP